MSQKMMLWCGVSRSGSAERAADFAEGRFQLHRFGVFDAAVFDIQAVEQLAVALLVPAHAVVEAVDADRLAAAASESPKYSSTLLFEAFEAPVVDQVLHAGDFAVGAVAEVALHFHDRDAQVDDTVGVDVAHRQWRRRETFSSRWA